MKMGKLKRVNEENVFVFVGFDFRFDVFLGFSGIPLVY